MIELECRNCGNIVLWCFSTCNFCKHKHSEEALNRALWASEEGIQ